MIGIANPYADDEDLSHLFLRVGRLSAERSGLSNIEWRVGAVEDLALAAGTVVRPQTAAIVAATLWVFPVVLLAAANPALVVVQWHGQTVCAVVLAAAIAVVWLRRDRFELGWTR